jgi:hypothetical protein
MALGLRRWEPQCVSGLRASGTTQRAPSLAVEAGILGVITAFLAAVALGILGSGLEKVLMWAL